MAKTKAETPVAEVKKAPKKLNNKKPNVIIGVGLLLVVISIAYSTTIIAMGTGTELLPKVLILPQVVLACIILVRQFIK